MSNTADALKSKVIRLKEQLNDLYTKRDNIDFNIANIEQKIANLEFQIGRCRAKEERQRQAKIKEEEKLASGKEIPGFTNVELVDLILDE